VSRIISRGLADTFADLAAVPRSERFTRDATTRPPL
jgi:hypothetical protein